MEISIHGFSPLPVPLFLAYSFSVDSENSRCSSRAQFLRIFHCDSKDRGIFLFFPFPQSFVHQQKGSKTYIAISTPSDALNCGEHSALSQSSAGGLLNAPSYHFYLSQINCQKWQALSILHSVHNHTNTSGDGLSYQWPEMEEGFLEPKPRALEKAGADRTQQNTWSWCTLGSWWQKILSRLLRAILRQ